MHRLALFWILVWAAAGEPARPLMSDRLAFLLLLLATAGALLAYRIAAARSRAARSRAARSRAARSRNQRPANPHPGDRSTENPAGDYRRPAPGFLADLSRRERSLEQVGEVAPPPEEIIDAEFTEVGPAEDDFGLADVGLHYPRHQTSDEI